MFGTSFLPLHILRPQSAPKTRILTPQNDDLRTAKGTFRHHAQTPLSSILNPTFFDLNPTFSPHFNFQAPLFQIPAPCRAPPPPPPVHVLSQLRAGQYITYNQAGGKVKRSEWRLDKDFRIDGTTHMRSKHTWLWLGYLGCTVSSGLTARSGLSAEIMHC